MMESFSRFRQKCLGSEYTRFRVNWIVIFIIQSIGTNFFMIIPSLHQFVTSDSHNEDTSIQPGLGLSETWYSWIISIASIGELVGALALGVAMRRCRSKLLLVAVQISLILGGVLYGVGLYGWMLLLSRFLVGVALGAQQAFFRVYLAESSVTAEQLLPDDKKKGTLKYTLFFFAFTTGTASLAAGPGLTAIAAQLPVDQFRWSGWFLCIHSGVLLILVVVFFRERWNDIRRTKGAVRAWQGRCPKVDLSNLPVPWYTIALIVVAFFTSGWFFAVLETLQNPLLSDNFGFSIKYSSYVILASSFVYSCAIFFVYSLQRLRVGNRLISLCGFVLLLIGSITVSDWQSIGGDPCVALGELSIDSQVRFSGGIVIKRSRCGEVLITEDTRGYVLGKSNDTTPTLCLQQPTPKNISTIICSFNSSDSDGVYDCYWYHGNLALTLELYNYETVFNNSLPSQYNDSGNTECSSGSINCGCIAYRDCDYLLLIMEPESIRMLENMFNNANSVWLFEDTSIELTSCLDNSSISSQCVCESFNATLGYECFWNPQSRVTGQYCERCLETCRSVRHSLNFVQAVMGLLIIGLGYPTTRITLTLTLSDCLGEESQGIYMGMLVASGSLSRLTGPLWGNPVYIADGRRTWLPMTICALVEAIIVVFYLLLYRTMRPKQAQSYTLQHDDDSLELVEHEEDVIEQELQELTPDTSEVPD